MSRDDLSSHRLLWNILLQLYKGGNCNAQKNAQQNVRETNKTVQNTLSSLECLQPLRPDAMLKICARHKNPGGTFFIHPLTFITSFAHKKANPDVHEGFIARDPFQFSDDTKAGIEMENPPFLGLHTLQDETASRLDLHPPKS